MRLRIFQHDAIPSHLGFILIPEMHNFNNNMVNDILCVYIESVSSKLTPVSFPLSSIISI